MIHFPNTPRHRSLSICVIGSTYARTDDDYAVPWLRESVARLVARGHRVCVLAPSYQGLPDHVIDGVPVHRFRYAPTPWEKLTHEQGAPNRIRNPLYQMLGIPYVLCGRRAARRLAKRMQFDIIHAHWPFPHAAIASIAAQACGAPVVTTCHGAEFALARRKKWITSFLRGSLQKADFLIANSTDTARQIHSIAGRTAAVIPFGSTVKAKRAQTTNNPCPRILFTGRLIQRKGVEYLLKATTILRQHTPVEVIITGDGDMRQKWESLSQQLGVQDCVQFLGFVSNARLDEEYARCDVWVNPSIVDDRGDTEGLGVGSIEAYMHRKPVVASAVGGIPDTVVQGTTGWLVPEKDEQQLATALLDLLKNPCKAQYFGEAGFQFAKDKFDWEKITDRIETAYFGLLGDRYAQPCHTSTSWNRLSVLRCDGVQYAS